MRESFKPHILEPGALPLSRVAKPDHMRAKQMAARRSKGCVRLALGQREPGRHTVLEDFHYGRMAGSRGQSSVPRDQRSAQLFGQRHVGRIVGAQILPESPDAAEQQHGSVAREAKGRQILDRLLRPPGVNVLSRTRRRRTWANSTSMRCTVWRVSCCA